MSIRTVKWRGLGRSVCAAVVATGVAATETSEPSANPAFVTIAEQQVPVYPATLPGEVRFPSPGSTREGQEYVVVRTAAGSNAVVLVTVENGDLNLRYGAEKIGKGHQLRVDGEDFPALAANGLHAAAELARTRSITGKPVAEITRLGRPGRASGIGFLAADEDIVSVLLGDNDRVGRLGLKHPDLARPLFHVWNLLLREYELGKLGRFKDDVGSFWYHGREIHLRSERTKGFQESIFNDEIKGAFDIELGRELEASERQVLDEAYAHLSAADREAMIRRLTRLRTGEMQPYYIMRYGFYEGHTEYRVDPMAIAAVFGLKSLREIDAAFRAELDQVLTRHFTATADVPGASGGTAQEVHR